VKALKHRENRKWRLKADTASLSKAVSRFFVVRDLVSDPLTLNNPNKLCLVLLRRLDELDTIWIFVNRSCSYMTSMTDVGTSVQSTVRMSSFHSLLVHEWVPSLLQFLQDSTAFATPHSSILMKCVYCAYSNRGYKVSIFKLSKALIGSEPRFCYLIVNCSKFRNPLTTKVSLIPTHISDDKPIITKGTHESGTEGLYTTSLCTVNTIELTLDSDIFTALGRALRSSTISRECWV